MEENRQEAFKVLIVDDDSLLRDMATMLLEMLGYETMGAAGGPHAIDLYQRHRNCIVLLDLSMSGMDGETCLRELQKIDPEVRVIISSGYMAEDELVQKALRGGRVVFLQKPYGPREMDHALRQVLIDG